MLFHFGNFVAPQDMEGKPKSDDADAGLTAKTDSFVSILSFFGDPPKDELSAVVPDDERNGPVGRYNSMDHTVRAFGEDHVELGHVRKQSGICTCGVAMF